LNPRAQGVVLAALVVGGNLLFQLETMGAEARVLIPRLADFRPEWNSGISFSLFAQTSMPGRYLLMALLSGLSILVALMLWRAPTKLAAAGYGLVLGGALGNLLDRVLHGGAVFDFLALHIGRMPLFVCNLPDIAISAGFVLLVLDLINTKKGSAEDARAKLQSSGDRFRR
jgi:signal peptidase II